MFPKSSRIFLSLSLGCAFWLLSSSVLAQNSEPELYSHISRGNQFLRRLQFAEAIKEYEDALKVSPGNQVAKGNIALSHNNWGIALYQRKNFDEAAKQWQAALAIDPNHGDAKRNLVIMKNFLEQQSRSSFGSRGGTDMFSQAEEEAARRDYGKAPSITKPKPETIPSSIKILKSGSAGAESSPGATSSPNGTNGASPSSNTNTDGVATYGGTSFGGASNDAGGAATVITGSSSSPRSSSTTTTSGGSTLGTSTDTGTGTGGSSFSSPNTSSSTSSSVPASTTTFSGSGSAKSGTNSEANEISSFGAGTTSGGTIEEALANLEIKVYGKKQVSGSLLSRLQQIEKDTLGKSGDGSIKFRIDTLRQTLGN